MNKQVGTFIAILLFTVSCKYLQAQDQTGITRSHTIQVVEGKSYYFHNVLKGQTLYSIARAYEVNVDEILEANPELKHGLKSNQMIRIPAKGQISAQTSQARSFLEHEVQRQETVYGISRRYNITIDQLYEANPGLQESGLRYRQIIRIPLTQPQVETQFARHIVQAGETVFGISRRYNTTVEAILSANPELSEGLKTGQEIRIPHAPTPMLVEQQITESRPTTSQPQRPMSYCDAPEKKDVYNIALLVPFYLNRIDSLTRTGLTANHPSFSYMQFYQGFLLATDSMRSRGGNFKVHVYDVGTETLEARRALLQPELRNADLIIGPFFPENLALVTEFAKNRDIPVVSPLLPDRSFLKGAPLLFQLNPSMEAQMADLARYVGSAFNDQNIILVHNQQASIAHLLKSFKDSLNFQINSVRYFRDSLNLSHVDGYFFKDRLVGERTKNVFVLNDSILSLKQRQNGKPVSSLEFYLQQNRIREVVYRESGIEGIKKQLNPAKENILITLIGGEAFVSNYVRELNELVADFNITLFGVSQWAEYENIEVEYLQSLNTHLFAGHFVDYQDEHVKNFVRAFRLAYKTEPSELAFRGVEAGVFFMNALHRYGPKFYHCLGRLDEGKYSQSYIFENWNLTEGWENQKVYIYKYRDYRLWDVRKPRTNNN